MWINCTNLNITDIEDLLKGDEPRLVCHILCEPSSITLFEGEFNDEPGWILKINSRQGRDPKLQFIDEAKAKSCYAYLVSLAPRFKEEGFVEIDALAYGAI